MKKNRHIDICLNGGVESAITNGFENLNLTHRAFPEVNLEDIDTKVAFLGKELKAPFLIAPMTGGSTRAKKINKILATAAQKVGVAMSVGSQRVAIENPVLAHTFEVRDVAPDVLLFANIGAIQLNKGFGAAECSKAVDMIGADALMLHLNPLQEALQAGGDTNYSGLFERIKTAIKTLKIPVGLREVSSGISKETAAEFIDAGAHFIDVGGAGGTSWALVEGESNGSAQKKALAGAFSTWGISTAESIINIRSVNGIIPVIATGGIRSGVDAAKAIALGADLVGIARPLLNAATESIDEVIEYLNGIIDGLRIAMFCTGSENIQKLKKIKSKGDAK